MGSNYWALKPKQKKGDLIRSYYIEIEKLIFEYCLSQNKKIMEEANNKTKILEIALKKEQDVISNILKRRVNKEKEGDVVYIFGNTETSMNIKIGRSLNIREREKEYSIHNNNCCVLYTKRCCDSKLLERMVHHILDQYREHPTREWFKVKYEIAKEVLDVSQLFLDGLVDNCDDLCDIDFSKQISDIISPLNKNQKIKEGNNEEKENDDSEEEDGQNNEPEKDVEQDIGDTVNPLDFKRFVKECCIEDPNEYAFSADIYGRHRLWCRSQRKTTRDAFIKFLKSTYKSVKKFDPNTGSKLASIQGIKLKPLEFNLPNKPTEFDLFFNDTYKISLYGRAPTNDIYIEFETWKKNKDLDYKITVTPSPMLFAQIKVQITNKSISDLLTIK